MPDIEDGGMTPKRAVSRREMMRRSAIVGGTLLWAAPAIQSLTPAAFAQQGLESQCGCCYCFNGPRDNPTQDQCADNGFVNFDECASFCTGRGFSDFRRCKGSVDGCDCNERDEVPAGQNGCTCDGTLVP